MEATDDDIYPPSTNHSVRRRHARRYSGAVAMLGAALALGAVAFWGEESITGASAPSTSVVPFGDSTQATHSAPASAAGMSDTPNAAIVDRGDALPTCVATTPLETRRDVEARLGVDLDGFNAPEQSFLIAASAAGADVAAMSYVAGS